LDLSLHLHRLGYEIAYRPHIVVGAKMRRVRDDHGALWDNLRWWPNTLRYHHIHSWPFALLGAAFLWTGSPIFTVNERIARAFGRAPMPID